MLPTVSGAGQGLPLLDRAPASIVPSRFPFRPFWSPPRAGDRRVKRAIISDIHGNLEALHAVFEDIDRQQVDSIYCLGDVVGYGPNPCECLAIVRDRCSLVLLGNHDQGALFDPDGFNVGAERAIRWTRQQLERHDRQPKHSQDQLTDFLGELPRTHTEDDLLFVHGSAKRPLDEYVFPEDIYNPLKLEHIFELIPRYCFQGHTHIPGVFTPAPDFTAPMLRAGENECRLGLPASKAMVNVGSVGQPRDGDRRACYVILEDEAVRYRRVEYPFETTREKIHAIPDLDNFLGDRLAQGR
jgi:diadenosine tetraphosphatase ApaH/serine/threonine PP2A family protein phosphatase